jgi:hypothetical protein
MTKRSILVFALLAFVVPSLASAQQILTTSLSGSAEQFGGDADGSGTAVLFLSDNTITYVITAQNIGNVTSVEVAPNANNYAFILKSGLNGSVFSNGVITGTYTPTGDRALEQFQNLKSDPSSFHVQIRTDDQKFGAVQGQLTGGTQQVTGGIGVPAREAPSVCVDSESALCLADNRIKVEIIWKTTDGRSGFGHRVKLTNGSGYFWFFDPDNAELLVKTVNGCSIGPNRWVFASGTTNVEVTMKVTDTETGSFKIYTNPQSAPFLPIQDTSAFACQ